jgi:tetratricopeptide (TPR) repeat protein
MSKKTQRERLERAYRTKLVVIVGCVLAVLIIATLVILGYLRSRQPNEPTTVAPEQQVQRDANVARAKKDGELRDAAAEQVKKGDTNKASELYSQAISSESDLNRKIQLYVDQSSVLYAAGRYTEAFEAAKKAEGLSNDKFLAADWLSRIYEDQKDYANAAKYYTLAGEWAESPQNVFKLKKDYYTTEAARVTALIGNTQ